MYSMISVLLILICVLIFSFTLQINAKENKETEKIKCYSSILIEEGDTLWSIAKEYKPSENVSLTSYIKEIKKINSLNSDTIHTGNYIIIYYYE